MRTILPPSERCATRVWQGFHYHQCSRGIKNNEGGRGYCSQHTPSLVEAKHNAKMAEYQTKWEKRNNCIVTERHLTMACLEAGIENLPLKVRTAVIAYRAARE